MQNKDFKKYKLPESSGIYLFKKDDVILYIGKATSLRDRTRSYFSKDLIATRGPGIIDMIVQANKIDWEKTDSVLEALILESELIKKYQPKYNIKEKDDKSWNYVCLTKEEIPKVVIKRGKNLQKEIFLDIFGPFTNSSQLKEAMKIIRRIFPYIDDSSIKKNNKEFYKQIGLTPDGMKEYKQNIKNLRLFFQGKKKSIIQNFKKEMFVYAKNKEFEKAEEIKKRIFALGHINDVALIKSDNITPLNFLPLRPSPNPARSLWDPRGQKIQGSSVFRVEAYDIAHLSGKNMVGVMTVIENGELAKNEYRKFIIKTQQKANDTGALEEVLARRFHHLEWGMPDLLVVDGNIAQIKVAEKILNRYQFKIPVVGVVKNEKHKPKAIQGNEKIIKENKKNILLSNAEAHRFAISFYRQKSRKNLFK
ncbi:MAG TPA: GIY-YIG nuclease family protein [Candidatus Paceibacterota bacterium]|nr:GIY-YIG nuclease family protein [Candidatus Paceibacterota bacterium]HPT17920.1 GIY-YIG nuclease family protein [Candidatus Paceibacterota bacterium]